MARDAFGIANEAAQQRAAQGTPVEAGEGADSAANHGMINGAPQGVTNGIHYSPPFKPDSWIPIAEHVLGKPQRKVKVISIGCGFSGMRLNATICERADMTVYTRLDASPQDPEHVKDG
jgi:hypothetical protein